MLVPLGLGLLHGINATRNADGSETPFHSVVRHEPLSHQWQHFLICRQKLKEETSSEHLLQVPGWTLCVDKISFKPHDNTGRS